METARAAPIEPLPTPEQGARNAPDAVDLVPRCVRFNAKRESDRSGFFPKLRRWVSVDKDQCVYWLTDVGLDGRQLTDALSDGYQAQFGLEILTSSDTPRWCVAEARAAASKAGFTLIRARRGTDKDRLHGIP
jgi:hypothetical protein